LKNYKDLLAEKINLKLPRNLEKLTKELKNALKKRNSVYLCGNGGSASNANHIANDFLYGLSRKLKIGLNVESLSSNVAVITCLANDIGYENIYSEQIRNKGKKGDLLIVLSGSGNSKNILKVLKVANNLKMKTFAILGYDGGKAKKIAKYPVHIPVNDMQVSEDLQMFYLNYCLKELWKIKKNR
tara:strand:+ start:175 stop:729 length:555 start_codon:yes stop_codon:yes gene_type:complete